MKLDVKRGPPFPWLHAQLLADSPVAWGHFRGRHLDEARYRLEHVFTCAVMRRLVLTEPRHRCILGRQHGVVLWKVSVVGRWAHYLSTISEGPVLRESVPITTSLSGFEEKSNRCLPAWCVEYTSFLELPWNKLLKHQRDEARKETRWG